MPGKREEYISWDEFFMGTAMLASARSKDPNNRVGACIVNNEHKIISTGYNGLTNGMDDNEFDWTSSGEKTGIKMNNKDFFVVHAERNAILNSRQNGTSLKDGVLYVTWYPCTECAKEIIQAGIKKVVYLRMYSKKDIVELSEMMFMMAGVEVVPYNEEVDFSKDELDKATNTMVRTLSMFSKNK